MAVKKPLTLNLTTGQIEQLQSGDTLANDSLKSREFDSATAPGQAVYTVNATNVDLAQADAQGTIRVTGLATEAVGSGNTGNLLVDGVVSLTTGEWDAVTGQSGGLTPGANYFLSEATAGNLTPTPPTTGFVVRVGHALSNTEFEIEIGQPIKL